ncbi:helix-turn-helix transcriptional regulator [Clostridium sp.]|uniref:helix-turn-helix domain-containing protein n=1 Tax=Clostridium sp. TaxID=1506 RepID=UPI0025C2133C|nr:helix-turn-helix transcriptional regulator [Clostridium sp.]
MKYDFLGVVVFGFVFLMGLAVIITFVIVGIFVVKALIRYIKSKDVRKEKSGVKKSLGEVLKQHREECKMTQEFVAESIGVSRQAVSKWENGISDPSTSNLIALAKLFKISAEDLLYEVH